MVALLEATTEWIETPEGYRLRWQCPDCDTYYYIEEYGATLRCRPCDALMQSATLSPGDRETTPPDEREATQKSALSW